MGPVQKLTPQQLYSQMLAPKRNHTAQRNPKKQINQIREETKLTQETDLPNAKPKQPKNSITINSKRTTTRSRNYAAK